MFFLPDLNLPQRWVPVFTHASHEAVHWSNIGEVTAPDVELLGWARANGAVVFTHVLDFGTLLALSSETSPSVIQVRVPAPLPELVGDSVLLAIRQHASALEQGALLTVEPARSRVRMLPLDRRPES